MLPVFLADKTESEKSVETSLSLHSPFTEEYVESAVFSVSAVSASKEKEFSNFYKKNLVIQTL